MDGGGDDPLPPKGVKFDFVNVCVTVSKFKYIFLPRHRLAVTRTSYSTVPKFSTPQTNCLHLPLVVTHITLQFLLESAVTIPAFYCRMYWTTLKKIGMDILLDVVGIRFALRAYQQ